MVVWICFSEIKNKRHICLDRGLWELLDFSFLLTFCLTLVKKGKKKIFFTRNYEILWIVNTIQLYVYAFFINNFFFPFAYNLLSLIFLYVLLIYPLHA